MDQLYGKTEKRTSEISDVSPPIFKPTRSATHVCSFRQQPHQRRVNIYVDVAPQ